ncbi:hypothetical protein DLM78_18005 [Leptospira stimsonii]|uniref:Uncharacterized protein n=1 Tax=Leptospira stimsonii TaxID=2202203 RepID=A0A8B3CP51_9LEPT|nr:hypothetical protein DLM78_18005 [Leptospira stimsonii]
MKRLGLLTNCFPFLFVKKSADSKALFSSGSDLLGKSLYSSYKKMEFCLLKAPEMKVIGTV